MLRIKIEKSIEGQNFNDQRVYIPAGSYEQTIIKNDEAELKLFQTIIAAINELQLKTT